MAEFKNLITLTQVFDGAPGEPGAPGKDGQKYYIETNQEEILKFKEKGGRTFSPLILNFRAYEISEDKYVSTSDLTFLDGKEYYELLNYRYVLTKDTEYNSKKTYYEINSILPTLTSFNFGYIYNSIYFPLYTFKDEVLPSYLMFSEDGKSICFEVETFFENEEYADLLESETFYFKFDWVEEGKEVAIKPISCRNGVSSDMATFNLHASGFNAAIQNTMLNFSEKGLNIYNGGIKIINSKNEEVFFADKETGNLTLRGTVYAENGEFKGTVYATSGDFTGTIHAESGEFKGVLNASEGNIGGFIISDNNLVSADGTIELNGKEGFIEAEKISLGIGAKINEYIEMPAYNDEGEVISVARIYNPNHENHKGKFIEVNKIQLSSDGILNIGNITLDGDNSKISGKNFYITPDLAHFSNIDCSGMIRTAVFEKNKVQSVGGSMIFRPSYKIEDISIGGYTIVLDKTFEGNENDKILLVIDDDSNERNSDLYTISQVTDNIITLKETIQRKYVSLIYIGTNEDIVIGINSNKGSILSKIYGEGLTITSWGNTDKPNLFLGNLENLPGSLKGYGLYADNVYLRGSLTTQVPASSDNQTYAGINTTHEAKKDNENIVFWAGAKTDSDQDISNASFIVTENGTIHATKGYFEGTIISKSTISGAHLYATHLHGGLEGEKSALYVHDTVEGICFNNGYESEKYPGTTLLQIKANGLYCPPNNNFIEIQKNNIPYTKTEDEAPQSKKIYYEYVEKDGTYKAVKITEFDPNKEYYEMPPDAYYVNFNGKNMTTEKAKVGLLTLERDSIISSDSEEKEKLLLSFADQKSFYFKKQSEGLESNLFFITPTETHNYSEQLVTEGNFTIQKEGKTLAYKKNDYGYDLYIS